MTGLGASDRDPYGKSIVLTGATSGIGLAAARDLARRGASVFAVGRSRTRCAHAETRILQESPDARIRFHVADLSSQREVREAAEVARRWAREHAEGKLDVLINNAAAVSSRYTATEDGYELTFAVNHLAPFLLSHELLPVLGAAPSPRVVTVSSGSHRRARIHWQDVMLRRGYGILRAYRQSKLANVLFTAEWNRRRARGRTLRAYAADPGLVNTEIGLKGTDGLARWLWDRHRVRGAPADVGARTVIFLATDPGVEGSSETYWRDCRPAAPDPYALRAEEGERLWAISERLCGIVPRALWLRPSTG